jgi:hypothetical protein
MDPARVLADEPGCAALSALTARLRAVGYDGSPIAVAPAPNRWAATVVGLARGEPVSQQDVIDAIGVDAVDALSSCGALHRDEGDACLTARLFPMRSIYTLLPSTPPGDDTVYLGADSIALFRRIWDARGSGDRAADLATGNGFIAAALATRYDHVVATDLSPRCAATAGLIPILNPHLEGRISAARLDVADGLRPGSFDLVTANAPWVPETVGPDGGPPRRFAAGGPTGCELPVRFIDHAAALLAADGRAFVACLDVTFADGARPLLDHLPSVRATGVDTTVSPTPLNEMFDYSTWVGPKAEGATAARHVIVELHRPR